MSELSDEMLDAAPLRVVPTIYPTSPPVEDVLDRFWQSGPELNEVSACPQAPEEPNLLLKQLGPSPFPRGGFPLIGFLATTYEKVSRYALDRE